MMGEATPWLLCILLRGEFGSCAEFRAFSMHLQFELETSCDWEVNEAEYVYDVSNTECLIQFVNDC